MQSRGGKALSAEIFFKNTPLFKHFGSFQLKIFLLKFKPMDNEAKKKKKLVTTERKMSGT